MKNHLGSSSWVSDKQGEPIQFLRYLPYGEAEIDQRSTGWNSRYTFSGKEKDEETGYSYFGARYYWDDLSIWLSVDPLAHLYPHQSPYMYCSGNPIMRIDPTGMNDGWVPGNNGSWTWNENVDSPVDFHEENGDGTLTHYKNNGTSERVTMDKNPVIIRASRDRDRGGIMWTSDLFGIQGPAIRTTASDVRMQKIDEMFIGGVSRGGKISAPSSSFTRFNYKFQSFWNFLWAPWNLGQVIGDAVEGGVAKEDGNVPNTTPNTEPKSIGDTTLWHYEESVDNHSWSAIRHKVPNHPDSIQKFNKTHKIKH